MILSELFVLLTSAWVRKKRETVQVENQSTKTAPPPSNSEWAQKKKSLVVCRDVQATLDDAKK